MNRMKATYVALTTQNRQNINGWDVVVVGEPGESANDVEVRASNEIVRRNGDHYNGAMSIQSDTELKNLVIRTKTQAIRDFPRAWREWNEID